MFTSRKSRILYKLALYSFVLFQGTFLFLVKAPSPTDSGNLYSASDTLSNSRLSYYAKVSGAQSVGTTNWTIQNSGNPDTNTNHLFPQDHISIGNIGNMQVATVSGTTSFSTVGASTIGIANGDTIYASQSAAHVLTFTNQSAITQGAIRVLIPAGTNTSGSNDGAPDGLSTAGFDFNNIAAANITCPTGGGVGTWQTPTATPSSTFGSNYHAFECRFAGSLSAAQALTFTIGNTSRALINPAPKTGHTQGLADTYNVRLQLLQYPNYNVVDSVIVTVSPVEAVLVSATVNPSLTFQISGVSASTTHCGVSTSVTTTATSVPFGDITATGAFYDAAHQLSVSTNAVSGYVVKVAEDDELSADTNGDGTPDTTLPDTTCDGANCSATTTGRWNTTSTEGWGYSLENSSSTVPFQYSTVTGNCSGGTYCAKQFACNNSTACSSVTAAQQIASSTAPSSTQNLYVCYRLNVGASQQAAYYQTRILYIATGTF